MQQNVKIKAIVVDDEEASRETLANYLSKYCPDVDVVAMCDSVITGLEAIRRHDPVLVFLDIEMPYGNAFDLLDQAGDIKFETVFVTAYSNYAIKAINASAACYLLKPIDIDELISAVEKVKTGIGKKDQVFHTRILAENMQELGMQSKKVVLPVIDGFEIVKMNEIIRCQGNGNFTDFFFSDRSKKMICRTLKFYEEILTDHDFMRVHKSHLVNMRFVKAYKRGKGGTLVMEDGSQVEVSPSKKDEVMGRF